MALAEYTTHQKKELVVKEVDFSLTVGHLYNMGVDEIMQRYVPEHERKTILAKGHGSVAGGHYVGKAIAQKVLRAGLWWPKPHKDTKEYFQACDAYDHKITPYHPQEKGTVEAFNKILENALTKVCNVNKDDWNLISPTVLWACRTTCKKMTFHTAFRLVYEQEVVIRMEYIVPSLNIATFIDMVDLNIMEERMAQLLSLEEDRFIAGFHQQVQKVREKFGHDRHIKKKVFQEGDLVLMYDSKFTKFPGKFKMHWLGPYIIKHITDGAAVQLEKLNGQFIPRRVNGSKLKLYRGSSPMAASL
eukprot:PITA_28598